MEISEREVDRILERLDQQDRIVDRALAETKEISRQISDALDEHTKQDKLQFEKIDEKLSQLLEFQARQKGAMNLFMLASGAFAGLLGWLISYLGK